MAPASTNRSELDDASLLAAFCDGDEQAFAELYQRLRVEVYRYVLSLTRGDEDLSHDVFQETFISLYEHAKEVRDRNSVRSWVFKTARNNCISHYRRSTKQRPIEDECASMPDTLPTPDEIVEELEMYEVLDDALTRLPDQQREIFQLQMFEGHSYADIARMKKTSIGIIRQSLWRARQTLRKLLASRLYDSTGQQK